MPTLTIAPLATPSSITQAARDAVLSAPMLFAQTLEHPCAGFIKEAGLECCSMDDLYESCEDFDELNQRIAARLMCKSDAVYAVLGRGACAPQLNAILAAAQKAGVFVRTLPSSGWCEAALSLLDPPAAHTSLNICPANALPERIDPYTALAVEEMDSAIRAGEVKLKLTSRFSDEHEAVLFTMDDAGGYSYEKLPLMDIDRRSCYGAATVLYVPPASFDGLARHDMYGLVDVIKRLRAPGGCPWDAEQTHLSLRPTLIEESYEVLDAIDREDVNALCEELGDLMLQIVLHAEIEQERAEFDIDDVATGIVNKLVYRHPHVFSTTKVNNADDVLVNWEKLKNKEKHFDTHAQTMRAVPKGFPALMRSAKIQKKAANAGFDWDAPEEALKKVYEEAGEVREALASGDRARIADELGDLLFSTVNVSRLAKCDAELALAAAADKFMQRFEMMEMAILQDSKNMEDMTLDEMDIYWNSIKR